MEVTVDKVLQLEAMVKQLEADKVYLIDSYNEELQRLLRLLQKANREIDKLRQTRLGSQEDDGNGREAARDE